MSSFDDQPSFMANVRAISELVVMRTGAVHQRGKIRDVIRTKLMSYTDRPQETRVCKIAGEIIGSYVEIELGPKPSLLPTYVCLLVPERKVRLT